MTDTEKELIRKKTQEDKARDKQLEAAAVQTLGTLDQLFGEPAPIKREPYKYNSRENFSYSENNGHMNEFQKAINNHKYNVNKPFNKMDGVGV